MTCIVGLEHAGRVYIGGDSAGVTGLDIQTRRDEKVFLNRGIAIGFTTSFRMGQVLRYSFTPPRRLSGQDDMRYLVTTFIDGLRDCYRRNGLLRKSFDVEACGSFLLGYRGTLYTIDSDFQIGHMHGGFSAVGCGAQIALGAMHAMRAVDLSPRKKILAALDAAERFSAGVRGPFSIVVTKKHVV